MSLGSWPSSSSGVLTGNSRSIEANTNVTSTNCLQGILLYCATSKELVCQQETLDKILTVLPLCTPTQQDRFLLYALYEDIIRENTAGTQ